MILSLLSALFLGGVALSMLLKAHQAKTCRVALLPLGAAVMEMMTAGYLTPAAFPVLTALLVVLRLTMAGCCLILLRRDVETARQAARREKLARRLEARTLQPMPPTSALPSRPSIVA